MIFWSVGSQLSYLVHPVNQIIPKIPGLGVILSSLGIILHCKWVLKWQFWISRQKFKIKDQIWRLIWVLLALLIIFIPITCIYHETLAHFNIICWIRALCEEVQSAALAGLGSILDTEDTVHSCIVSVSKIHFDPAFINGICI